MNDAIRYHTIPYRTIRAEQFTHSRYSYDTENGISVAETGQPKNIGPNQIESVKGQYSYTAPDGTPILVTYTADENGFLPSGAHLPTPPPIPVAIQRSLAYNAAHPEEEERYRRY
jgi:hypothetical protein